MLSRSFTRAGSFIGDLPLSARLYTLAGAGLAAWTLVMLLLVLQEQALRKELDIERAVFTDLIDSTFAFKASFEQAPDLIATKLQEPRYARVSRDQQFWSHVDRTQRNIARYGERHTPAEPLAQLFKRISGLHLLIKRLTELNFSRQKQLSGLQSTLDASATARVNSGMADSHASELHKAERKLAASFDALLATATKPPGVDDLRGTAQWINLLKERARDYATAYETADAEAAEEKWKTHLSLSYGDRATVDNLVSQLIVVLRTTIVATSDYTQAYDLARGLLIDGAIYKGLMAEERSVMKALDLKLATTRKTLFLILFVGIALIGIATIAAIRYVTRPRPALHDDTKAALSIFGGTPDQENRRDEVDSIATAFREMTDRLDDATLSVNHLGEIISALSIGLLVTDGAGHIRMVNPAFKAMAGYPEDRGDLIGLRMEALFGDEIAVQLRPRANNMSVETTLKTAEGRAVPVMMVSTVLPESATFAGIVCATIDLSERMRAEERLRAGRERIESLVQHMHEIQEMERNRIAKDLHDDLGAVLTALRNGLVRLSKLVGASVAGEATGDLVELADRANTTVDRVIKNLWPQMLDHFGLGGALEALAAEFEQTHGIRTTCDINVQQRKFERRVELALYRTSQEALTNIAKHAHARSADISLEYRGMETVLEIGDDGHGFVKRDHDRQRGGYGLLGMRQRIAAVGGTVSIDTGVQGSKITVTIPLTFDTPATTAPSIPVQIERRRHDKNSTG